MAKFCTDCGKKLEEGKTCSCKEPKKAKKVEEVKKVEQEEVKKEVKKVEKEVVVATSTNEIIDDMLDSAKGMLNKPLKTISKYSKSTKYKLGLVLMALAAVAQGIFAAVYYEEVLALFFWGSGDMMSLMAASSGLADIKQFDVFLYGALYSAAYYAALVFGTYFVVNKLFKVPTHYKRNAAMIGTISIIPTATYVLSLVGFAISLTVGFVIMLVGLLYFLVTFYHSLLTVDKVEDDKAGKVFILITAISIAAIYLVNAIIM